MSSIEAFKLYGSAEYPTFTQFETNTRCNTSCHMCPHSKMKPRPEMKWGNLLRLIDEVAPLSQSICPFLMQEPALEKRLPNILNYIKQVNPRCMTSIYTNMAAFTPELSDKITRDGNLDELHISFYGPTEELYNKWQPGLGWQNTINNIQALYKAKTRHRQQVPVIKFQYITIPELMGEGYSLFHEYIKIFSHIGEVYAVHYDTFHGDMPDYGDEQGIWGDAESERLPCPRLWSTFNIHSNGDVVPCCLDYKGEHVLGNVFTHHPLDIWRNEEFEKLRQLHVERRFDEIPLCKDCTLWMRQYQKEWKSLWLS